MPKLPEPEANITDPLELPIQQVKQNRPTIWLAGITVILMLFLLLLPADIRAVFWQGLQAQAVLVIMLVVFSLVALSLVWSAGQRLDIWFFLTFNLRWSRPPWLDQTMLAFTQLGSGFAALGIALVSFVAGDRLLAYKLMLGTLTLWLVVEVVKLIIHRARPFIKLTQARVVGGRARGRSFPSGHTSQSFFIATLMIQHFHASGWMAIVLYVIALMVGITRMYVGAHYPRDVLAGAILGSAWGLLGVIVNGYVL